jgi:preprotein translocase subunit SecG
MKKLMTLMLGLAFLTTTVAVGFAQEKTDTTTSKKKSGKKKGGSKKTETETKQ